MVSRVSYRPFDETDFDAVARIVQAAWHTYVPGPDYTFLEASCDLAHALSVSTFSQLALIDGEPRGIVLARSGPVDEARASRWRDRERGLAAQMAELEPDAAEEYGAFMHCLDRVNAQMRDDAASLASDAGEITLLVVDTSDRGLGIGDLLFDAARSYIAAQGADAAYLFTDTTCNWEFYEHQGLERLASHRATRDERRVLPREMYLYALDLNA